MIVQVEEGQLRGIERTSLLYKKPFYAFLGIPYAKPPIGDLRFRAPVPYGKWDGVLDAMKQRDKCMQTDVSTENLASVGSEDCLYLNVYVPKASSETEKKLAVIVYIHGGGFFLESSHGYPPNFLIDYNVILVTLNYRLHVFGFLNTGTPSCPGNVGLKDQLLAMKWVKRNIASFGGDPENITLMGQSAGGTSVHLHMLSPLSKGLFKRAIPQSGYAFAPWAFQKDAESQARKVARLAGYEGDDLEGLVGHLKNVSADKLCELALQCAMDVQNTTPGRLAKNIFIPSVEKIKIDAFLPDTPRNLMASATPVPAIIGFTNQEGLSTLMHFAGLLSDSTNLLPDVIPLVVKDNFCLGESERSELVAKISEFYSKNELPSPEKVLEVENVCSDLYFMKFFNAIDHLVKSDVPPYIYLFAYNGKLNRFKPDYSKPYLKHLEKGATHGDDLGYLFQDVDMVESINGKDLEVIEQFCALWTNFAKTGNPTSSFPDLAWTPHTDSRPCYLQIGENLTAFKEKLCGERFDFWKRWSSKFL